MAELILYHFPGACSQTCVFALEQTGLDYQTRLVDLSVGAQTAPPYLAVSPLGKVPALLIDHVLLTENAAIVTYINALRPDAGLFQDDRSPLALARRQAGFSFCGGNLHPIVRGIRNPQRMTEGDVEPVRQKSIYLAHKSFGFAEQQLAATGWWLGARSVIDVYLNWAVGVAIIGGFDMSPYPALAGLKDRLMAWPAFATMIAKEGEAMATLQTQRQAA